MRVCTILNIYIETILTYSYYCNSTNKAKCDINDAYLRSNLIIYLLKVIS